MRKLAKAYRAAGCICWALILPFSRALINRGPLWLIAPIALCCVMVAVGEGMEAG